MVGGKELAPIMKKFKVHGINFIFKSGGGKSTGGKDGWWAKTDIVLPVKGAKSSVSVEMKEDPVEKTVQQVSESDEGAQRIGEPADYMAAVLPVTEMSPLGFSASANKGSVIERIIQTGERVVA